MGAAVPIVFGISALTGLGGSIYQGKKQAKAAKQALAYQEQQAAALANQQAKTLKKLKGNAPSIVNLASTNAAKSGSVSTALTSPQGIPPEMLMLGRQVLLGQ